MSAASVLHPAPDLHGAGPVHTHLCVAATRHVPVHGSVDNAGTSPQRAGTSRPTHLCVTDCGRIPSEPCGTFSGPTHTYVAIEAPPCSTRRSPPNASFNPPPAAHAASPPSPSGTTARRGPVRCPGYAARGSVPARGPRGARRARAAGAAQLAGGHGVRADRPRPQHPGGGRFGVALARFGVAPYDRGHVSQYPP